MLAAERYSSLIRFGLSVLKEQTFLSSEFLFGRFCIVLPKNVIESHKQSSFLCCGINRIEQRTLKNVNSCLNTNIYSYLETSGGQSSNLYLNVVHFFNTCVNYTSVADKYSCFLGFVSTTCCSIVRIHLNILSCFEVKFKLCWFNYELLSID